MCIITLPKGLLGKLNSGNIYYGFHSLLCSYLHCYESLTNLSWTKVAAVLLLAVVLYAESPKLMLHFLLMHIEASFPLLALDN